MYPHFGKLLEFQKQQNIIEVKEAAERHLRVTAARCSSTATLRAEGRLFIVVGFEISMRLAFY